MCWNDLITNKALGARPRTNYTHTHTYTYTHIMLEFVTQLFWGAKGGDENEINRKKLEWNKDKKTVSPMEDDDRSLFNRNLFFLCFCVCLTANPNWFFCYSIIYQCLTFKSRLTRIAGHQYQIANTSNTEKNTDHWKRSKLQTIKPHRMRNNWKKESLKKTSIDPFDI